MRLYNSLSQACLIILIANPQQLFNIGFQLSFLSVISIVYISPIIKRMFGADCRGLPWRVSAIKEFLISAFCISLAVWIGLMPFILYYFRIVSPVTIFANIVVLPHMSLVIALGLTLLFVGMVFPAFTPIFAGPANLSIVILIQIIKFFNQIPGGYFYL